MRSYIARSLGLLKVLYTSPPGDLFTLHPLETCLHFTPGDLFTLHPLETCLHFTPWRPVYTSPPGDLFTLHPLETCLHFTPWRPVYTSPPGDLFIPRPSQLIWEAFGHAAITARILFVQISTSVCSQIFIDTAE